MHFKVIFLGWIIALIFESVSGGYHIGTDKMSWPAARAYCLSFGSNLASIHSAAEQTAAKAACGKGNDCWLGLYSKTFTKGSPNPFKWVYADGTAYDYSAWNPHEPSPYPVELCTHLWGAFGHNWNNVACSQSYYPLCDGSSGSPGFVSKIGNTLPAASGPDYTLSSQSKLRTNRALISDNGEYVFALQSDGNLVVYKVDGWQAVWATNRYSTSNNRFLVLQKSDGNLVAYSAQPAYPSDNAYWATNCGNPNAGKLVLENNGDLVAYTTDNTKYWSTSGGCVSSAKTGLFNIDGMVYDEGESLNVSYWLFSTLVALLVINCVCLMIYWYKKRGGNKKRYAVVSMESDSENENLK